MTRNQRYSKKTWTCGHPIRHPSAQPHPNQSISAAQDTEHAQALNGRPQMTCRTPLPQHSRHAPLGSMHSPDKEHPCTRKKTSIQYQTCHSTNRRFGAVLNVLRQSQSVSRRQSATGVTQPKKAATDLLRSLPFPFLETGSIRTLSRGAATPHSQKLYLPTMHASQSQAFRKTAECTNEHPG
jgi:hypothetical protein